MIWLLILGEVLLFVAGIHLINKYDKEAAIKVSKKEYVIMGTIFAVSEIVLFSFYGYGREFCCHSLMLYYLTFAAFIDHKTKNVYRVGSMGFLLLMSLMLLTVKDMGTYGRLERSLCILIFSMVVIMQGTLGWMGWGDVYTYIGVFAGIGSWNYQCMSLELMAVYMLLANLLFVFMNIRKFNLKKLRLKEDAAFLPGMAGAMMILEVAMKVGNYY